MSYLSISASPRLWGRVVLTRLYPCHTNASVGCVDQSVRGDETITVVLYDDRGSPDLLFSEVPRFVRA